MDLTEIFKAPFRGSFSNSKLKINESIVINLILSVATAVIFSVVLKIMMSDAISSIAGDRVLMYINLYISSSNSILLGFIKLFILLVINLMGLIFVFSGIMYVISNILKSKITYEECLSICTYANIIPSAIMIIGIIFLMFSFNLSILLFFMQSSLLIIFIYESFSQELTLGKSKIMSSIAICYIIKTIVFFIFNYLVMRSMIAHGLNSMF